MLCFWAAKGGSGCSVTAAAVALLAAATTETLLVDLAGEQPAVLGLAPTEGPTLADWLTLDEPPPPDALARLERPAGQHLRVLSTEDPGWGPGATVPAARVALLARLLAAERRQVVVDVGRWSRSWAALTEQAGQRILVTRACYLALRAAASGPTPTGVVLLSEPGRALTAADVASVVEAPVRARIPVDPAIARAVDAGLFTARLPRPLRRLQVLLAEGTS